MTLIAADSEMGKKTVEERRRYDKENGFNNDNADIKNIPIPRDILDYSKEKYNVQMELWFE